MSDDTPIVREAQTTLWPAPLARPDVIAAILRIPVTEFSGRPTPARVAHIERAAVEGLVPAFLASHLVSTGHVDDASWRLVSGFWEVPTADDKESW